MVKGTTKSGIKYQLDPKIKDDARMLFLLTKAQKQDDPMEASKCVMSLMTLIFGSDDNVMEFMDAVAEKHDGVCKAKDMAAELQEMIDGLNTKN